MKARSVVLVDEIEGEVEGEVEAKRMKEERPLRGMALTKGEMPLAAL